GRGPHRPPGARARPSAAHRGAGHRLTVRPLSERLRPVLGPVRRTGRRTAMTAEIWFLTGSQGMYGEDTLRQVADQSREVAAALGADGAIPVPISWRPVLTDSAAIRRVMLEADADDDCVGVIAWMHTFSP